MSQPLTGQYSVFCIDQSERGQYYLAIIAHGGEGDVHGHPVDDDADHADEDHQGQHRCDGQPGGNKSGESGNKKTPIEID